MPDKAILYGVLPIAGMIFILGFLGLADKLEQRIATLERTVTACCSTEYGDHRLEGDLELIVVLRRTVADLEKRVKDLEK